MKLATHLTFAAAALLAAAFTGSAQTLTAEIPFAFHAGGARMAPGTYKVYFDRTSTARSYISLWNQDDRRRIMVMPLTVGQPRGAAGENPVLTFRLTNGRYDLAQIWDGSTQSLSFPLRRAAPADSTVAQVVMKRDRGQ